jgi:hypothetical protein
LISFSCACRLTTVLPFLAASFLACRAAGCMGH